MELTLRRHGPQDPDLSELLALIRRAFAEQDGRVDPPSSMHRLTLAGVCETARTSEVWSLGTPLSACMILSPIAEVLYIGKLAVAPEARRTGLADRLIAFAEARAHARAHAHGMSTLEAQSRVQMTEVHDLLNKAGFREVARTAHPGFTRPTSITFRKDLA